MSALWAFVFGLVTGPILLLAAALSLPEIRDTVLSHRDSFDQGHRHGRLIERARQFERRVRGRRTFRRVG